MAKQKINYRIIILLFLLLSLATCSKMGRDLFGVKVRAVTSPFAEGISGVKYKIIEIKEKISLSFDLNKIKTKTSVIKEGVLEKSNDYQVISFYGKNTGKYSYIIQFDFSGIPIEYSDFKSQTGGKMLDEAFCNKTNTVDLFFYKPLKNFKVHYFNANCFDETDEFKYKQISILYKDEIKDLEIIPWTIFSKLQGCADYFTASTNASSCILVYQWEAIKNGIKTTDIDTFLVKEDNQTIEVVW